MKRYAWLTILLLTLVACRPMLNQTDADTSPLSELPGGSQGPFTTDITGESVVIEFTTGEPTVCNVTYGTDEQYGSTASNMMLGGAARNHNITLDNLMPNTTYHYRLNINDKQGNLYQSNDFTFITQSASKNTGEPAEINIASLEEGARIAGVSSNFGGGDNDSNFGANNAIDGRSSTQWSSNGDGDNAWIEIALPGEYDVTEIGFWTRTMANNTATIFSLTVTTDQGETYGPFELPDTEQLYIFPVSFTASVLRFDAEKTNTGNTGALEILAYGTPHTQ